MRLADTEVIDLSDKVVGVPAWVWIVIFILAVFNKYVVPAISNLAKGARNIVELARELRGGVQRADRRRSRRQFAEYTEARVRDIDRKEQWSHHRFAELEAEVEMEADGSFERRLTMWVRNRGGIRRERSLSRALAKSRARLILL